MTTCTVVNKERKLAIQLQLETWRKKHEKKSVPKMPMRSFLQHSRKMVNTAMKESLSA